MSSTSAELLQEMSPEPAHVAHDAMVKMPPASSSLQENASPGPALSADATKGNAPALKSAEQACCACPLFRMSVFQSLRAGLEVLQGWDKTNNVQLDSVVCK